MMAGMQKIKKIEGVQHRATGLGKELRRGCLILLSKIRKVGVF